MVAAANMAIMSSRSNKYTALSVLFLLSRVTGTFGFVPVERSITRTRIPGAVPGTSHAADSASYARLRRSSSSNTRLQISLDDSWTDLINVVDPKGIVGVLGKDLSIIEADLRNVDWGKLLSGEVDQILFALKTINAVYWSLPLWEQLSLVLVPSISLLLGTLYSLSHPPVDFRDGFEPYKRGHYDPLQAKVFYAKHPKLVVQRAMQLLRISNRFLINILIDKYVFRDEERQRAKRAKQLLELVQKAGPTAIKVAQALSVRQDLIPIEYAEAFATLQDRVPPFPSEQAKLLLRKELGVTTVSKFRDLNMEKGPVASASIGQVYRGYVGDTEVAVKVQRPNALAEIALDLYLVREFAPIWQKLTRASTDLQSLAQEWGRVFIGELDYNTEAKNTIRFNEEMKKRKLDAVTAPVVLEQYCTEKVLVTGWIRGTRIDQSQADDVPRLCSVALNAYLVMLLELQSLHCDPHPGNLLRTEDGRLAILDFGMTLETEPTLQYSLLEFVAHLTSMDYDRIPEDLVELGFLKEEKLESVRSSGVLEPLKYFLKQANEGGGAEKVRDRIFAEFRERYPGMTDDELRVQMRADMRQQMEEVQRRESAVTGVTVQVEELQKRNRDAFSLPEWFLYTSRAFLTLEGVSLQADENYSIIKSCFPYVAKRLLGDDSPRTQKALRDLLYGAGDAVDVDRLSDLAEGFSSYTTTTKTVNSVDHANEIEVVGGEMSRQIGKVNAKRNIADAEATITLAKDSAEILLAPQGNLLQNLLVEESALATSAGVKDALQNAFVDGPRRIRESVPFGIGSFLPFPPIDESIEPFLKKTSDEEKAQKLFRKLSSAIPPPALPRSPSGQLDGAYQSLAADRNGRIEPEQAALVAKELRKNLPKYAPLAGQLGGKFASTLLKKASSNIDTTLSTLESKDQQQDRLVKAAARVLSTVATRGADLFSSHPQDNETK